MGKWSVNKISNMILSSRNIFYRPPEPPAEILCSNPSDSIFIGKTKMMNIPYFWTYENVANPHIAVVGISGSGKSYLIKSFLVRSANKWNTNAVIIDWAGEYKGWVRDVGGKIVSLGKGSYLNILDTGGMKPYDRIKQVMRTLEILTDIAQYPEQKRLTEEAIERSYMLNKFSMASRDQRDELGKPLTPPTLNTVVKILEEKAATGTYEFPTELENAIYRLKQFTKEGQDFFARQSTVSLKELVSSGIVDIDLSGLPDEEFRALAALSILQFIKEYMRSSGWASKKGLRLLVVLDEAWKIAKEDNSDAVMIVREGRKYNFGLIVASQNPTDISEAIFSNVGTSFILKIKFQKYLDYLQGTLNFSDFMRREISTFGVGQAAVNLSLTTPIPYPQTFIIKKIIGEEPSVDLFLVVPKDVSGGKMAKTISFEKDKLRKKLLEYGLGEEDIVEILKAFEEKSRRMNILDFVLLLEKYGMKRKRITEFLQELEIEDAILINIFIAVDKKKRGSASKLKKISLKKGGKK